jgi:hypothetical protein
MKQRSFCMTCESAANVSFEMQRKKTEMYIMKVLAQDDVPRGSVLVLRKQTAFAGNSRAWKINIWNAFVQEICKELVNFSTDSPEMAGVGHPSNRARHFAEISLLRL